MSRLDDLLRFYEILAKLEKCIGGKRCFSDTYWKAKLNIRGVYFLFEPGEYRNHSASDLRVVRVGTLALKPGSKATILKRLEHHVGNITNLGGNHRGSVFRLHAGNALINRDNCAGEMTKYWGQGNTTSKEIRKQELPLEQTVSEYIRPFSFLWVEVDDPPTPEKHRDFIESNSIALLSNFLYPDDLLDSPSESWLGLFSNNDWIKRSGLWNVNHVDINYDPSFLDLLESYIEKYSIFLSKNESSVLDKNYQKYYSYKYAFERIDAAITAGFYLEAITIEESILTDRLLRFCRNTGYDKPLELVTLGGIRKYLKDMGSDQLHSEGILFLDSLSSFWKDRCTCLHQIAKSDPGEPTMDFEEVISLAEQTAINGKILIRVVCKWANKYKSSLGK